MFKGGGESAARKGKIMTETVLFEFAKHTVVLTSFWLIIMLEIWGIGGIIVHFVKWVKGCIGKKKEKDAEENTEPAE